VLRLYADVDVFGQQCSLDDTFDYGDIFLDIFFVVFVLLVAMHVVSDLAALDAL